MGLAPGHWCNEVLGGKSVQTTVSLEQAVVFMTLDGRQVLELDILFKRELLASVKLMSLFPELQRNWGLLPTGDVCIDAFGRTEANN